MQTQYVKPKKPARIQSMLDECPEIKTEKYFNGITESMAKPDRCADCREEFDKKNEEHILCDGCAKEAS